MEAMYLSALILAQDGNATNLCLAALQLKEFLDQFSAEESYQDKKCQYEILHKIVQEKSEPTSHLYLPAEVLRSLSLEFPLQFKNSELLETIADQLFLANLPREASVLYSRAIGDEKILNSYDSLLKLITVRESQNSFLSALCLTDKLEHLSASSADLLRANQQKEIDFMRFRLIDSIAHAWRRRPDRVKTLYRETLERYILAHISCAENNNATGFRQVFESDRQTDFARIQKLIRDLSSTVRLLFTRLHPIARVTRMLFEVIGSMRKKTQSDAMMLNLRYLLHL